MEVKTDTTITITLDMNDAVALSVILAEAASKKNKSWNAGDIEDCVLNELQCLLDKILEKHKKED